MSNVNVDCVTSVDDQCQSSLNLVKSNYYISINCQYQLSILSVACRRLLRVVDYLNCHICVNHSYYLLVSNVMHCRLLTRRRLLILFSLKIN